MSTNWDNCKKTKTVLLMKLREMEFPFKTKYTESYSEF